MSRTNLDIILVLLSGIVLVIIGVVLWTHLLCLLPCEVLTDYPAPPFGDQQHMIGLSLATSGVIIIMVASFAALKRAS
ncbi:MAG: hypothetical protein ACFFDI_06410 [Promethearchaeota archaeon]